MYLHSTWLKIKRLEEYIIIIKVFMKKKFKDKLILTEIYINLYYLYLYYYKIYKIYIYFFWNSHIWMNIYKYMQNYYFILGEGRFKYCFKYFKYCLMTKCAHFLIIGRVSFIAWVSLLMKINGWKESPSHIHGTCIVSVPEASCTMELSLFFVPLFLNYMLHTPF